MVHFRSLWMWSNIGCPSASSSRLSFMVNYLCLRLLIIIPLVDEKSLISYIAPYNLFWSYLLLSAVFSITICVFSQNRHSSNILFFQSKPIYHYRTFFITKNIWACRMPISLKSSTKRYYNDHNNLHNMSKMIIKAKNSWLFITI